MTDAGRNDPCPCGSGKKFKKCCLAARQAAVLEDLNWIRMRRTEGELIPILLKHLEKVYGSTAVPEAWEDFTVGYDLPMDHEITPEVDSSFPIWLLYDWDPDPYEESRDRELPEIPVARHLLENKPMRLDSYQVKFITEACDRPFSFFQVTGTVPGQNLMLRDLLLNREVTVHERQSSSTLRKGNILFTKVITLEGDSVMLGCAPIMIPGRFFDRILSFRELVARHMEIDGAALREYDIELRQIYFELRKENLDPSPPRLQNTDGDPLQMTKIHYHLKCPVDQALNALMPLTLETDPEEFHDEGEFDDQGRMVAINIPWLKKGNSRNPGWDNTVLGQLDLRGTRMVVAVNSQPRAERIQVEIERLLGNRAELKNREIESLASMAERLTPSSPAESDLDEEEQRKLMADPQIQARIREMATEHWRTWPDIALPSLDGLTPRQAAKDPIGRDKLEALLLEFEGRPERPEGFDPDWNALRKELGL